MWSKMKIQLTTMEKKEIKIKRNFVNVQMNHKNIKFQLVICPDLTLIIEQTWKKISRPTLLMTKRSAHGNKLNFEEEF